jgi:hypothetical protein
MGGETYPECVELSHRLGGPDGRKRRRKKLGVQIFSSLLPGCHDASCSALPDPLSQWTETSETVSKKTQFLPLSYLCQVFCHSNEKVYYIGCGEITTC